MKISHREEQQEGDNRSQASIWLV